MLDIKGNATDPRVARLSNFTSRVFVFDNVSCASIEGLLQAFKCSVIDEQERLCSLSGREAKLRGAQYNSWKITQVLWWRGQSFDRCGRAYVELITSLYDTVYAQDKSFRDDLSVLVYEDICHSIGNPDMRDTVLTEVEMIYQINRLRICAFRDRQSF